MKAPTHLKHKPIIAVNDYDKVDSIYANNTDVKALSIGQAQYDDNDLSVKIWRHTGEKWSRQSEEMPLHRALDLSILAIAAILADTKSNYSLSNLREEIVDENRVAEIRDYFKQHENMLRPRLEELRKILNTFFDKEK
jgi:hypothetical protein